MISKKKVCTATTILVTLLTGLPFGGAMRIQMVEELRTVSISTSPMIYMPGSGAILVAVNLSTIFVKNNSDVKLQLECSRIGVSLGNTILFCLWYPAPTLIIL